MESVWEHLSKTPRFRAPKKEGDLLLFHYTTYVGFLGIVNSRSLWGSNIHYMNDSREFQHGFDIVEALVARRLLTTDGVQKRFLERLSAAFGQFKMGSIYVVSFTEEGDVLSQWRGYASPGGVSLGFGLTAIKSVAEQAAFKLIKCVYDAATKDAIATDYLVSALQEIHPDAQMSDSDVEVAAYKFIYRYFQFAAAFKDNAFKEENEWRLISRFLPMDHPKVKVRATERMLVPFFELSLDRKMKKNGKEDIGLELITIGPSTQQRLIADAIGMASHGNGVNVTSVTHSIAPYRTF